MSEYSAERLTSKLGEIISTLIVRGEIKNPNLSTFTSITRIDLAPDNSAATVYVNSFEGDAKLEKSVRALNSAASFIQGRVAKVMRTRNTPVLTFRADISYREGEKVNDLIATLVKDNE
jgi:ribosome-binding factor A